MDEVPDFSSPWHFSDVVLVIEGTKFHVHRSTLSIWSPVFERMFTSGFTEKTAEEIPLPGKRAAEIEVLLRVMYTFGKAQPITEGNYTFLLELAEEYQMDRVKELCAEFLNYNLQESNCLKFYRVAEHFKLKEVMARSLEESRYQSLANLQDCEDFEKLGPEIQLKVYGEKIKELERTLQEYAKTCSALIDNIYRTVAARVQESGTDCDNIEVHRTGVREPFKMSCKCCRRRVQNTDCKLEYSAFRGLLKKLFDLEHYNRTARRAKNSGD
ncbi:kelch repeat and BTB domain-containing protein 2 [Nematostella vectensis]|nr:kelch repeat and BTB domain-containing protein 2 [Nematostella vectensis]